MIAAGSRLGPYEIGAPLGAGGMGEVYRARDSRLDRTVAIKVLPRHLSSNEQLRERFEREARAISALSHPHICTLYDIGHHDGVDFLVMEYLDGESLADRLARGPLPIEQVIRYGVEIAEALEKAHRAGIVHRDLKPGNVIITKSGAKLLDFGLAKFAKPQAQSDPSAATAALIRDKPLTEEGTILGTFQYMAPEQIEGRDADARTDIFAFGALLYEMATGKRAFEAKTRASLIASILDRDPAPISSVQPLAPQALQRIVSMCLAKDPDERWQSAHDVAAELKWTAQSPGDQPARPRMRALQIAAIALAAALFGALAWWGYARATRTAPVVSRFEINTPAAAPMYPALSALAVSPDGRRIVYRAYSGNRSILFTRSFADHHAMPIAGTEGSWSPVFSPDGKSIAFLSGDDLHRVSVDGSTPTTIAEGVFGGLGAAWEGDTIYVTRGFAGGVWAVPASGGTPRQILRTDAAKGVRAITWPDVLPGGESLLGTIWNAGSWDNAKIAAFSVRDGSHKVLIDGGTFARYSPSGHLLYLRGGNLMAVRFDPKSLEISGTPVAVVRGVSHGVSDGEAQYAVSRAGHLVYVPGSSIARDHELVSIGPNGNVARLVPTTRPYGSVALSPDQRTALVTLEKETYDLWALDLERDSLTRVSFGSDDSKGIWTPDGQRVVWTSSRSGADNLYWRAFDSGGAEERLTNSPNDQYPTSISPDGKLLLYWEEAATPDIWLLPLDTRKPRPLVATPFDEGSAQFSPDGRWIAYTSSESGRFEVHVQPFPGPGGTVQVSIDGGDNARWMPDGRAIVFTKRDQYFVVPVETSPRFRAGKPRLLSRGNYEPELYDIAPDGRILTIRRAPPVTTTSLNVVLNWTEDLKRRVPAQ